MRAPGTLIVAALVAGLVAGTVQVQMAISFKSGEEFIVAMLLLTLVVIVTAAIFGITLATGSGIRAVTIGALGIYALLVVFLLVVEYADRSTPSSGASSDDVAVLSEILIPALLAIAIEWWAVRRHVNRVGSIVRPLDMIGTDHG